MELVREIEVDAGPEDMWEALTDAAHLEESFANEVELDPSRRPAVFAGTTARRAKPSSSGRGRHAHRAPLR